MQKCPQCKRTFSDNSLKFCPQDNYALESEPLQYETKLTTMSISQNTQNAPSFKTVSAKYVFMDIVGFTRGRSVEAQSYLVQALNLIVKNCVRKCAITQEQILYIPTGDGICVAILNNETPFDVHMQFALHVIKAIQDHNDAIEKEVHKFQVRIGINANIDNLITDINDNRNIAGAGISMAARIMDKADGNQILVGRPVFDTLRYREKYVSAFRYYRTTVKHGIGLDIYQLISAGHVGLDTDEPQSLKPAAPVSKRIVLVIPALAQNGWFAELIQETLKQLHLYDYEVIVKIPYKDFSKQEQKRIFEHLERHPNDYIGGIIVIHKHEDITKEITELCNEISYPIVFADVRPFDSESDYLSNTAFVGYDEKKIGELAARRVATRLREIGKDRPIVKVICSATSQTKRQDAFCEELRELIPNVDIEVKREGEFRRSKAKDIAVKFFDESMDKKEFIDAVFCTNDEMALGVYDAMLTAKCVGREHPYLVGVDGVKSAKRLIQTKDAHFNATIEQPAKELSQQIVAILNQKIKKEFCPTESFLIPKMYDKEIAQAEDKY